MSTQSKQKRANTQEHKLIIRALYDAQAHCKCGRWEFAATGERTRKEIAREYNKHVSSVNARELKCPHCDELLRKVGFQTQEVDMVITYDWNFNKRRGYFEATEWDRDGGEVESVFCGSCDGELDWYALSESGLV